MSVRHKRMLGILLGVVMVSIWWGCAQPDDILSEVESSTFILDPQRLPQLPADMAYELWVTDGLADTVSLGKFKWNSVTKHFTDLAGVKRPDSSQFNLPTDALNYKMLLVSVEVHPDTNGSHCGPVMLLDTLNDPDQNPIALRFPLSDSLWNAISYFNMETPTDSDHNSNEGSGIWFSGYQLRVDSLRDTFALTSFNIVRTIIHTLPDPNKDGSDTIYVDDIVNIRDTIIRRYFGLDTLQQRVVLFDRVMGHDGTLDSTAEHPYRGRKTTELFLQFHIDTFCVPTSDTTCVLTDGMITDTFSDFFLLPGGYGLIDYSAQGWLYRAWVVSTVVADAACGTGTMTPPAWVGTNPLELYLPGYSTGSLLSIGRHTIDTLMDMDAPYSIGSRHPNVPGEDFLQNLPCGSLGPEGLIPWSMHPSGTFGSVFVSLEPSNFTRQGQTNFPLIFLSSELPRDRNQILADTTRDVVEEFLLRNWTGTVNGNPVGFPRINVTLIRK